MDKPTKPINLMPREFGGIKNNFNENLQLNGYEPNIPAIYAGDNLNYQLDATGKELDYCEKIVDFINDIPIGKTITVNDNNKLVYDDFSVVARTGDYSDLINKPTIPSITNLANKDLSNLSTTGQSKLDAKVNKSGDTMTGNLSITKSNPHFYLKNTDVEINTIPQESQAETIYFQDKNSKTLGDVGTVFNTDGSRYSLLRIRKASSTYVQIEVGYDASGNSYFSFPKCTSAATTTSTASSSKVAVVVKNYKNGTSWYRVWSDGWIEQGGRISATGTTYHSGVQVSLLRSFSDKNYSITLGIETKNNSAGIDFQDTGYFSQNTNYFYVRMESIEYMSSLSWYACGY